MLHGMTSASALPSSLQSMRMVVRRTGLTPDVLRAWEKRYGAVNPARSSGGQRMYDAEAVERLLLLSRAVAGGRPIRQVASLGTAVLRNLVDADAASSKSNQVRDHGASAVETRRALETAIDAIERLDATALEAVLRRATFRLGADVLMDGVVTPLFTTIGERWHAGQLRPSHEHLGTAVIRRTLDWIIEQTAPGPRAPAIVVATPAGQAHEMGAMLAAAAASSRGWRVIYLGADLPAGDIAGAAIQAEARAVALSLVHPAEDRTLPGELQSLRAALARDTALLVGGAAAASGSYRAVLRRVRAVELPTFAALREWLSAHLQS
jgi:methanogenic corrinoid protein MtbC1